MPLDIENISIPTFDWTPEKRRSSLDSLYAAVSHKLDNSIKWYQSKRPIKRLMAWFFRLAAMLFTLLALTLPVLAEIFRSSDDLWFHPAFASIAVAVAGFFIGMDRFSGSSSAWMRYMSADMDLKEVKLDLSVAYNLELASLSEEVNPSIEQTKHVFQCIQGYLTRCNQILKEETNQWKSEFQTALQQIEEQAKTPAKQIKEAVITVRIANPEGLASGDWKLSINNGSEITVQGVSKAIRLTPGTLLLKLSAKIKKQDGSVRDYVEERSHLLSAETATEITFTLPLA